jgi:hypothetical protein
MDAVYPQERLQQRRQQGQGEEAVGEVRPNDPRRALSGSKWIHCWSCGASANAMT